MDFLARNDEFVTYVVQPWVLPAGSFVQVSWYSVSSDFEPWQIKRLLAQDVDG